MSNNNSFVDLIKSACTFNARGAALLSGVALLFVFAGVVYSPWVAAANIYVTRFNDTDDGACDSDCSLREAINLANANADEDRIVLSTGTYLIEIPTEPFDEWEDIGTKDENDNRNGDFDIVNPVMIVGDSRGGTIIDAQHKDRVFDIISGTVTLKQLTLQHGRSPHFGGALRNQGAITLWYSSIINNSASASFYHGSGGGMANFGVMSVNASTIAHNRSSAGESSYGRGGGIYNEGKLVVRESVFENNDVLDDFDSGSGGGVFNLGEADIRRSAFLANESVGGMGGAIFNAGTLRLFSSTVSGNVAGERRIGWAVANHEATYFRGSWKSRSGVIYIYNTTIVDNFGGGFWSKKNAYVENSIIAGNVSDEYALAAFNCAIQNEKTQEFTHVIFGFEEKADCVDNAESSLGIHNDDVYFSLLNPLTRSGRVPFYPLLPGSIAIDTGSDRCPHMDLIRNYAPQDGDGDLVVVCDIGAVEYQEK